MNDIIIKENKNMKVAALSIFASMICFVPIAGFMIDLFDFIENGLSLKTMFLIIYPIGIFQIVRLSFNIILADNNGLKDKLYYNKLLVLAAMIISWYLVLESSRIIVHDYVIDSIYFSYILLSCAWIFATSYSFLKVIKTKNQIL